ncbi:MULTISPECIES: LysR family transcriptional regulator [Methylibium]|uniref:Transcriptional regulator, LysR family n=1 Tax=Methylibium petroleiphilum (strain ATCC BAA-1232 / LMG 22953 / PM1) TaxID=420662 RepID=A2SJJ6_METPP|nr:MULTISPECIES: LysR family transcriptional regulator [Methylibium]ABM95735.1 transcriptional regulator, LysR family [Methylibium petroleiphilum PM1]EWS56913.1 HTH-type transcriptional activator CmpR [Methylibium sp. T29]EWS61116.1 HTH-type transcriptional activator CmpR [Methylibium sp. T29-B]
MLKNATLRQLSAFHAVARLGSVSRAASELYLTQPAVSIQLKLLEESAGTPLLQREGRGVRLTPAGDLMASYAGRILDLWRDVGDEMATLRGVFSGTLRVGAVTTAEYLLPPLLVSFANEHPNVKVKLRVGNRDEIVRMLAAQEVDLVIMGRPPGELKTVATAFAKHPMAFIASPRHPLMAQRRLTLADLEGASLLARERGSGTRTTLERLFKDEAITLRIGSELSSNEAIKQMCVAGFGVAFLSLHTCRLELDADLLQLLPLDSNPVEREWFVLHLASRQLPQVAVAFEQFLTAQGQRLIHAQLQTSVEPKPRVVGRRPRPDRAALVTD